MYISALKNGFSYFIIKAAKFFIFLLLSILALNTWISDYAKAKHIIYVDYYTALVDDKKDLRAEYSKDGVHPNLAGYKVMEGLAIAAVNKDLN